MPGANHPRRGARRALLLALAAPAALLAFVLWMLHHPNPRVIAPVALDRNSLLPHQYAGPCLNCHRIVEVGPVAINAGNMDAFPLSPIERQLLLAGQRVDVPSLPQKLRIPAITRTHNLPHQYVGVCSNCHVVLDVHPSPEFMSAAMRNATQPLLAPGMDPSRTARGGAFWDATRARNRSTFGYVALLSLMLVISAPIVRRVALRRRGARAASGLSEACLTVHAWGGAAFCVAATLHWYYSDRGNNLLHLALVILSAVVAVGVVVRHRLAEEASASRVLLPLHRLAVIAFIALLGFGHLFAGLS